MCPSPVGSGYCHTRQSIGVRRSIGTRRDGWTVEISSQICTGQRLRCRVLSRFGETGARSCLKDVVFYGRERMRQTDPMEIRVSKGTNVLSLKSWKGLKDSLGVY